MTLNANTVRMIVLIMGLGFVASVIGCDVARDVDPNAEPANPLVPPSDLGSQATEHKPGFIAVVTAGKSSNVVAPYTTASASMLVKLGDIVVAGQPLARLDDRELRQELDVARSQQRTAHAQIVESQVDARGAEVVSRREQAAAAAGVSSHAEAVSANQALAKATAGLSYVRASAAERAVRIAVLEAHLREMALVAPISGRVAMIYVHDGARVEQGDAVLRLISMDVFVKFAIPVDRVDAVSAGDTVDVRFGQRDEQITATVRHVAPEIDGVAQLLIADAELVNPPADLQPGTVCRIVPRTRTTRGTTGGADIEFDTAKHTEVRR